MKKILIIVFALCLSAMATNSVYIAQTAQGAGTGVSCATAKAVSYFNTVGNWSSTPTGVQIGPDTTAYICGTITTDLTFQANGTSGHPVILDGSQSGALMAADIHVTTSYWTLQNLTYSTSWSTTTFYTNAVDINGASFGTIQNNHIDVQNLAMTLWLGGGAHDVVIQNNYLAMRTTGVAGPIDSDVIESEGSHNITVQGNYVLAGISGADNSCVDCHDDVVQVWDTGGLMYNWIIRYNYFVQNSPGKNQNQQVFMFESIDPGYFDIYSNVFESIAGGQGSAMINLKNTNTGGYLKFYNNTLIQHSGGYGTMWLLENPGTYYLSNNLTYVSDGTATTYNAYSGTTVTRDTNLWFGGNSPSCTSTTDLCGQDPLFTNFSTRNFTLQSGSPARSLSTNLGTSYDQYPLPGATWPNPSLDTRPASGAWDAGAYQYQPAFNSPNVAASVQCSPVASATKTSAFGSVKICKPSSDQGGFNCGPPSYTCGDATRTVFSPAHVDVGPNTCNWTSLTTLATCGNLTGQNTIVTPGTFGSQRIMRLTDQTTSSTFSVLTADDGLPTLFNLDSTGIIVKRSGGFRYLFHFNPTTMQTTGVSAVTLDNAGTTYSRTQNNVIYQLTGANGVTIKKTTVTMNSNPANDTSSTVTIKDLGADANCFGATFSATSVSLLLAPGGADKVFTVGASTGIQNTGTVVVSYNVDTGQCTTVDTSNGQVTQNGTLLGTYDASNGAMRGTWHEAYQSPNARYALIVMLGISGPFIWDLQNPLSLVHCPTSGAYYCDGHDIWGNAGLIRGKSLIYHSYANPDVPQRVNLPSPPSYPDMHPSWNNDYASDDSTWFLTKAQDATIDATPLTSPVAFYNEMWMTKPDGSNTISRQCHTFSSGQAKEFDSSNALASISPDGKFAAFASDWEGSLGSLGGASTCVLGATDATGCRSDVFVCELK